MTVGLPTGIRPDGSWPSDPILGLLELEIDQAAGRGRMVVASHLLNAGGTLWGGAGLSAAVAAGEAVLGRGCLWATVQYVRPILGGAPLELAVDVGQHGRGLSQVAVRGTVDGELALLATGTFGGGTYGGGAGITEQFVAPPDDAPAPDDCPVRDLPPWLVRRHGMLTEIEQRVVRPTRLALDGVRGSGRTTLWMRLRRPVGTTPAALAILADLAPSAITEAMGEPTFGRSLDNSIRVGRVGEVGPDIAPGRDWVLLDVQVEAVLRGVAQINARMFSRDGHLLAIAGQSARMRRPTGNEAS